MNTESAEGEQRLAPWTPAPTEPVEGMRRAREGAREKNSQQSLEASRREAGKGCSEKDRTINRAKFYREGIIFTILIILIHEHGIFLHLSV